MAPHRILVVDDDFLVRFDAAETLEDAGYDVIEACDVESALVVLKREQGIGLVCTDVNMPGELDGIDLAMMVRNLHPKTKIIVMSGLNRRSDCPVEIPFLTKPFQAGHLVELAREQLEAFV